MEWLTTTILLARLTDFEDLVWDDFVGRFRGPLIDFGRRLGLADEAAQDAAQDTLLAFARAYRDGRYDRNRGRLRSWLFGIAVNEIRRRRERDGRFRVSTQPADARIADDEAAAHWQDTWDRHMLRECLDRVRDAVEPTTFALFEGFAMRGVPARQVALEHDVSPNAVFLAKRRVLRRLEAACRAYEGEA